MKKKSLFFLLFVMCVGWFIPKGVFALDINNNINIDYRFYTNDSNNTNNIKYKLYDKSNTINIESNYDATEGYYYFKKNDTDNLKPIIDIYFPELKSIDFVDKFHQIRRGDYDLTIDERREIANEFKSLVEKNKLIGGECTHSVYSDYCSAYMTLPLVIENLSTNEKKIVYGAFHISIVHENWRVYYAEYIYNFSLINNDNIDYYFNRENVVGDGYWLSNNAVEFMRNAMSDYTDELWEELNSGPIASSEMQYDNSDTDLSSPKLITFKTNNDKAIYSKYKSNVNYRFKVKNGNGMKFMLHDVGNVFNFSSTYDKDSDTYSIVDNSSDNDYQDGIKNFSEIIINEVKNGNFSGLASKYNSITSDNCSSDSCDIYTYIPMILEGESNTGYAKQIVLGLVDIQYRQENGNDYYDIGLNVYNNTCDLLNSDIDTSQNNLINLSRSISEDYSSNLMNQYSDGSIALADIYDYVDVNTLKDKYCNELPVISLRQNPKTLNNGIVVLIISMMIVIGSGVFIIKRKSSKI